MCALKCGDGGRGSLHGSGHGPCALLALAFAMAPDPEECPVRVPVGSREFEKPRSVRSVSSLPLIDHRVWGVSLSCTAVRLITLGAAFLRPTGAALGTRAARTGPQLPVLDGSGGPVAPPRLPRLQPIRAAAAPPRWPGLGRAVVAGGAASPPSCRGPVGAPSTLIVFRLTHGAPFKVSPRAPASTDDFKNVLTN